MLEVRIPDGWEEMMRQAYADAGDDSLQEEGDPIGDEEEEGEPSGDQEEEEDIPEDDESDEDEDMVVNGNTSRKGSPTVDDADNGRDRQFDEDSENDSEEGEDD
ncbi:hypothetical protein DXG03_007632 [Asterophora parasitica]|uniref:Uncharacterized protein n=1 Tax=Asterophora parasitica TaxID=117018 RepID=A0A9P7G8Q8_9AGAR|nr:hypothetical protein DXG03_007632 [Asterophora parasitica]